MPPVDDPYWKLRPEGPTAPDELCACPGALPIVLQDHLSALPLACLECNGEMPPERVGFTAAVAEKIAFWRNFHRAFLTLWLDSREYEAWARRELEDPEAPVNVRGLAIVRELNELRRTYYWWFQDNGHPDFVPRETCPRCVKPFTEAHGRWVCEGCLIAVTNA